MGRGLRWGLLICYTGEWIALAVWVGGLVVLVGSVLPAVFNTFGGQDAGGLFLTRSFEGYNRLVLGAIAILACGMVWRRRCAPLEFAPTRTEAWLLGGMVAIAGVIIFFLHPLAAARQAEVFALRPGEGRKEAFEAFFQIHMPVRTLYMVNLCLGLGLAGARVHSWEKRMERST